MRNVLLAIFSLIILGSLAGGSLYLLDRYSITVEPKNLNINFQKRGKVINEYFSVESKHPSFINPRVSNPINLSTLIETTEILAITGKSLPYTSANLMKSPHKKIYLVISPVEQPYFKYFEGRPEPLYSVDVFSAVDGVITIELYISEYLANTNINPIIHSVFWKISEVVDNENIKSSLEQASWQNYIGDSYPFIEYNQF